MTKIKQYIMLYKESKMKTIHDWIALELTLSWNFKYNFEELVKKIGEGNRFWLSRTLRLISIIIVQLNEEKIVNLKSTEILDLEFLINVIKNTKNKKIEDIIKELPGVSDDFSYNEDTLRMINFYNNLLKEILFIYKENTMFKMYANDYEYILRYSKKDNLYIIYYLKELAHIRTIKQCFDMQKIIEKENLIEPHSLQIAEMLSC